MTFQILGTIIPFDELHHFSEGLKPTTRQLLDTIGNMGIQWEIYGPRNTALVLNRIILGAYMGVLNIRGKGL